MATTNSAPSGPVQASLEHGSAYVVPLARQAVALLRELQPLTGHGAHGFRALARTVIVENLPGVDPEWIEAQLAHAKKGPLGSAHDRAQYLRQRRQMMQTWADYLDRGSFKPVRPEACSTFR